MLLLLLLLFVVSLHTTLSLSLSLSESHIGLPVAEEQPPSFSLVSRHRCQPTLG